MLLFVLSIKLNVSCISRVRQNVNKSLSLVDPDPGKCYTRANKANFVCVVLRTCRILQKSNSPRNELHLLRETGALKHQFSPTEQFSFINIVEHAKIKWKECSKLC